jgi:glycosyltransferase involved in cell wall biosynthesis
LISFVIPAYNEERYLGATIAAIHDAMTDVGARYEIVVADDASTDGTAVVAANCGARVVRVEKRQIAATRNAGAQAAHGGTLIFVDADTHVNAAAVRAAIAALGQGFVGGGARVRFHGSAPRWSRAVMAATSASMQRMRLAAGCFIFCTRADFEAVGGFDERHFAAEEIWLSHALKRRGRFVVVDEVVTTSPRKVETRSLWDFVVLMAGLSLRGLRGVRRRESTSFWYDGKR